ncbi:hypothetical protein Tco_1413854 [Tanacetum coccineum]
MTVYPPNTPAKLVHRALPTKSQVKINIYTLTQLFAKFDKTCKKRITPCGLTERERGFEQTKECYLTEVIPFFKMIKEHFEGIQKALVKEVKEMKEIFKQMKAEVEQNDVDKQCPNIKRKNLLIENENLIANCLSHELLYSVMDDVNTVSRFSKMHDAYTVKQVRCLELKAEISKLKHKIQKDDHSEMIKCFSNIEDAPEFDTVFEINIMKESLQGKDNTIRKNNREVHLDYLKHLKESVETLREIVKEARIEKPLDNTLGNVCFYTKRSQELLEYVIGTCLKKFSKRDKKIATTPLNRNKQVAFREICETSNNNTQIHVEQQKVHKTNVLVIPSTGVNSSTEASGSKTRSNIKNNRILPAKSDNKKKVEDHPRNNKLILKQKNRVDSSISSKRTIINSNSNSVCKTCNKCLIYANHDKCVVKYMKYVHAPC